MINKTLRLSNVDIFFEKAVKKGISNVELTKRPIEVSRQGEYNVNYGWFNNRTKSLIIV